MKNGTLCVKAIVETLKYMESSSENGNIKFIGIARRKTKVKRAVRDMNTREAITAYLDIKDTRGDTALSLAAKNENPDIVQYLLQNSASIASKPGSNEKTLPLIYSNTPSAVISLLDTSVSFYHGEKDYDLIDTDRKYCINLT